MARHVLEHLPLLVRPVKNYMVYCLPVNLSREQAQRVGNVNLDYHSRTMTPGFAGSQFPKNNNNKIIILARDLSQL